MTLMRFLKHRMSTLLPLAALAVMVGGCKKSRPAVAQFTVSKEEVLVDEPVTFMNSSQHAKSYQWDFGDGGASTQDDPEYAFPDDGNYTVSLIARGEDNTDTAFHDVDVYHEYTTTMYEGTGIEGAFLEDPWSDVKAAYGTDTVYSVDYSENVQAYYHVLIYENENLWMLFVTEDSLLQDSDPLVLLYIFYPFAGGTTKRVGFLSTMKRARDTYGTPEGIDDGSNYTGFWYDSQGIDIYTYDTDYVDEIDLYLVNSLKSATLELPYRDYVRWFRSSGLSRKFDFPAGSMR